MMLANAWPMAPQLGAYLCTPAPMTGDGLNVSGDGKATQEHVLSMLTDLCLHPADPDPKVMQLEKYWHPRFNWYGPAGIGTNRGISGFRNWHQIPFLRGMPDRKLDAMGDLMSHWFAQGNYVCETGWPNMRLTLSADGWMGIAPSDKEVLLRSLDFWRMENGLIRENWVLVDLLDLYRQVGVDELPNSIRLATSAQSACLAVCLTLGRLKKPSKRMNEPIVFLPGMMCDARLFAPQIALLSKDHPVIVMPITGKETVARISHRYFG